MVIESLAWEVQKMEWQVFSCLQTWPPQYYAHCNEIITITVISNFCEVIANQE